MTPLYRLDGRQYSAFVFAPADHRLPPERGSEPRGVGDPRWYVTYNYRMVSDGNSGDGGKIGARWLDCWGNGPSTRTWRELGGFHEQLHSSPSDGVRWAATIRSSQNAGRHDSILPRP